MSEKYIKADYPELAPLFLCIHYVCVSMQLCLGMAWSCFLSVLHYCLSLILLSIFSHPFKNTNLTSYCILAAIAPIIYSENLFRNMSIHVYGHFHGVHKWLLMLLNKIMTLVATCKNVKYSFKKRIISKARLLHPQFLKISLFVP